MKKIKNIFGIFRHKASRPIAFKELFGINQLSACDRDGSRDSYDFVGTIMSTKNNGVVKELMALDS